METSIIQRYLIKVRPFINLEFVFDHISIVNKISTAVDFKWNFRPFIDIQLIFEHSSIFGSIFNRIHSTVYRFSIAFFYRLNVLDNHSTTHRFCIEFMTIYLLSMRFWPSSIFNRFMNFWPFIDFWLNFPPFIDCRLNFDNSKIHDELSIIHRLSTEISTIHQCVGDFSTICLLSIDFRSTTGF